MSFLPFVQNEKSRFAIHLKCSIKWSIIGGYVSHVAIVSVIVKTVVNSVVGYVVYIGVV